MTTTGPDPTSNSASGKAPGQDTSGDGIRNLADAAARLLDGYAKVMGRIAGGGGAYDGRASSIQGLTPALAEAWMIASGSSMRYGQGLSDIFARHQSALTQAASVHFTAEGPTPEQKRAEAEELRQFLCEVGRTAVYEARRLEQELAGLGEAVAQGAAEPWPEGADHRVWAVKT